MPDYPCPSGAGAPKVQSSSRIKCDLHPALSRFFPHRAEGPPQLRAIFKKQALGAGPSLEEDRAPRRPLVDGTN